MSWNCEEPSRRRLQSDGLVREIVGVDSGCVGVPRSEVIVVATNWIRSVVLSLRLFQAAPLRITPCYIAQRSRAALVQF